jgi:intein-encoded DNA endonuclease-like protein
MKNVYDFEPKRYKDLVSGVIRIGYFNVALSAYLQEKSKLLFESVEQARPALKREFLRAFFDDEGCMDYRIKTNARRIRGYQKDPSVLMTVQNLLKDFAIESQIQAPNEVVISGKENLIGFKREIDFSAGVRINGNRSNSVWKEDLEKRILLERAIESFVS